MRRDDGPLAREYNIHRIKEQGRIAAVEPRSEKQQPTEKPIPAQIKAQLAAPPCVAPYTSTPERNHKASRRNNPRLSDASRVPSTISSRSQRRRTTQSASTAARQANASMPAS